MTSLAGPNLRIINTWSGSIDDVYCMRKRNSFLKQAFKKIFEQAAEGLECSICYEGYLKDKKVMLLPCGHLFHDACHKIWQPYYFEKQPCPYCMQIIEPAVILSDKGEEYSCSLDKLRLANPFFSSIEFVIEDLIKLKKKLQKKGEENFDPLLRYFFELLKTYHSLKINPHSNDQINFLVKKGIEDLFRVFFSLDLTVRINIFDLVVQNLSERVFREDISFKSSLLKLKKQFFSEPKNPQSYFINNFCDQLVSLELRIKKEKKGDFDCLKDKIFDRAFRTHLINLETTDPIKQYAYLKEMPSKYFSDFGKRIEKTGGTPTPILNHSRKIQQIRDIQKIGLFSFAVLAITGLIGWFIFRDTFKGRAFSS